VGIRSGLAIGALCLTSILAAAPARAAEDDTAAIRGLDASRFPQIKFYLSLANYMGAQPAGLQPSDLEVREEGTLIPAVLIQEETTGYRLILVLSSRGDGQLALPSGERRIDAIRRIISGWLAAQPDDAKNDYSLITSYGAALLHSNDQNALRTALQQEPPLSSAEGRPLQTVLTEMINIAADPGPSAGMRTIALLITDDAPGSEAQAICPRARGMGVLVYGFWIGNADPPTMDALGAWTASCAGYAGYMENEPGLRSLLTGMLTQKKQYQVTYRSKLNKSGDHALTVSIQRDRFQAKTATITVPVQVQPPTVSLSYLPDAIHRSGTEALQPAEAYEPQEIGIEAVVAFPDGHPRNIASVVFLIDGEQVSVCDSLPCPALRWDLRSYADSGNHTVRISVQDELGLVGDSAEQTVFVAVDYPSTGDLFWAKYSRPIALLGGAAVLIALFVVVPKVIGQRPRRRAIPRTGMGEEHPPLSGWNAVATPWRHWWNRWLPRTPTQPHPPELILQPLQDVHAAFPLADADVVIGSRAEGCDVAIPDPSLSPRHARMTRNADGTWWVLDLGSVAGTWIQWEEVAKEGSPLRVGDILHLGRVAFRVELPVQKRENELGEKNENSI
jgi:hypothetical protein